MFRDEGEMRHRLERDGQTEGQVNYHGTLYKEKTLWGHREAVPTQKSDGSHLVRTCISILTAEETNTNVSPPSLPSPASPPSFNVACKFLALGQNTVTKWICSHVS